MVLFAQTVNVLEEPPVDSAPSDQLDVEPVNAKLYNVPLLPLLVLSVNVDIPVFVPLAVPWLKL